MASLYEAAGGAEAMGRLSRAWHERMLADEMTGHPFSHGYLPDHCERLAAYWGEALGGPPHYSERYGTESDVVRIHAGCGEHEELDRRAIACFDLALADAGIDDAELCRAMHDYFAWATTASLARYPHSADDVPEGLAFPRWSWEGLLRQG